MLVEPTSSSGPLQQSRGRLPQFRPAARQARALQALAPQTRRQNHAHGIHRHAANCPPSSAAPASAVPSPPKLCSGGAPGAGLPP